MPYLQAVASWSGGKDSCLALYQALADGHAIKCLLSFVSEKYKRCCFHGTEQALMKLQAERIGFPIIFKEMPDDMLEYKKRFKEAVSAIKDVNAMCFGDIYLDEHKDWVEGVCKDLGVACVEPLWDRQPEELVKEFIALGFKAIVVSCQADKFGKEFVGRIVDLDMLSELKARNICPCGENGEFHTLVIDGPVFKKRIEILESAPILKEGFWKYWFLDIKQYQ